VLYENYVKLQNVVSYTDKRVYDYSY